MKFTHEWKGMSNDYKYNIFLKFGLRPLIARIERYSTVVTSHPQKTGEGKYFKLSPNICKKTVNI